MELPIFSWSIKSTGGNLDQSCRRTKPFHLWDLMLSPGNSARMELNCRTPNWCQIAAWWCRKTHTSPLGALGTLPSHQALSHRFCGDSVKGHVTYALPGAGTCQVPPPQLRSDPRLPPGESTGSCNLQQPPGASISPSSKPLVKNAASWSHPSLSIKIVKPL